MDLSNYKIILNSFNNDTRDAVFTIDSRDPITLNISAKCVSAEEVLVYIRQYCSDLLDTEEIKAAVDVARVDLNDFIGTRI